MIQTRPAHTKLQSLSTMMAYQSRAGHCVAFLPTTSINIPSSPRIKPASYHASTSAALISLSEEASTNTLKRNARRHRITTDSPRPICRLKPSNKPRTWCGKRSQRNYFHRVATYAKAKFQAQDQQRSPCSLHAPACANGFFLPNLSQVLYTSLPQDSAFLPTSTFATPFYSICSSTHNGNVGTIRHSTIHARFQRCVIRGSSIRSSSCTSHSCHSKLIPPTLALAADSFSRNSLQDHTATYLSESLVFPHSTSISAYTSL